MFLLNPNQPGWGWEWWTITGTLSDQTDLQTALDAKIDGTLVANRIVHSVDGNTVNTDSNHVWDWTNHRVGIQVATPQVPLHVASVTWTTLNNVTAGSATLVAETLPTAPSGSVLLIPEPAATSGGSVWFIDQWMGNYTGNNDTYDYRIYTCLDVSGTYYLSQYNLVVSGTIPFDFNTYNISVDWTDVTITGGTAAYYVEKQVNGGGYSFWGIYTSSQLTDSGSGTGGSATAYPTFYQNIPWTAPTAYTGGSATGQDIGSGAFNEIPTNILVEVDSVVNIGGINYVSGSPTGGSFSDSGFGTYNPEVSWTDNGGATNSIARVSQDSGISWIYKYTGSSTSPFKFTDQTNDSDAQARWWQTYSAGSVVHDFSPYGIGTAPSGSQIYSTVGTTYSATLPADSIKYILKHSLTGGSPAPYKILAPQASPAYGIQFTGDHFDIGYTTWGSGATVTPQSYGFSGTDQNREYKIYSSGSGIFGGTPLELSTVASSGSKSVSIPWTLPSGITTVKILRRINGVGSWVSKTVSGTSTTDDATDGSWTGNDVVTPTSIIWGTARFDKALTVLSDEAQLAIVESGGSGQRYSKISFWVANNSSSAATYQSHLYSSSNTGYLSAVTSRFNVESSLGGTPAAIIGTVNSFNNAQSSTIHFNVKGQNDASLINTRSDMDTVGFGQALGSDPSATVQIHPARAELAVFLKGHSSHSSTSQILLTSDNSGTFGGAITVGGHFQSGGGNTSNPWFSFRADTDTGIYNVSPNAMGVVLGSTERIRWTTTWAYFGSGSNATARVHIAAGSTSANTAPIKLTSGTPNTSPEVGALEFQTDTVFFTVTTSSQRRQFLTSASSTVNGQVIYGGANNSTQFTSNFTYSSNRLSPTYITLAAGTATAGTCPEVMTSGTLLTTAIAGGKEFLTDKFYGTITTGAARKEFTLNDTVLTPGIIPVATTNGRLTDSTITATKITKTLFDYITDTTVGGAEADIYSSTTAASQLSTNGDKFIWEWGGNFVTGGTELTQLKAYFAWNVLWDSTGVAPTTGTTSWRVYVEIIRKTSTSIVYTVSLQTTGASGFVYCKVDELTGLTLSGTNILKITGTSTGVGSGSGDIVGKMGYVRYVPAV